MKRVSKLMRVAMGGLKYGLDLDFSGMPNGAIPTLLNSGFTVSGGKAINSGLVAGLGNELVTDGGFENWDSTTDLHSWTETIVSSSTVNQESTERHGGTYAVNFNIDSSAHNAQIIQATVVPQNSWVLVSVWAKNNVGATKSGQFCRSDGNPIYGNAVPTIGNSTTMTRYFHSFMPPAANEGVGFKRTPSGSSSCIIYADDLSEQIAPSNIVFDVALFSSQYGSVKAAWTRPSDFCLMGVVMCLDYPMYNNYVIAYHDTVNLFMKKKVNGTFSTLINTPTAYIAGANIMIKRTASGNIFQAWYGAPGSEAQVGTDQTILDASIIGNKYHGLFDVSPGLNTCSRFIYNAEG